MPRFKWFICIYLRKKTRSAGEDSRVSWTARRPNQSIPEEINSEYSWEGLMLKLKLQYFGHLMRRTESLEKTLMLGKIEGRRRRGRQRMRWLDGITDSMDMGLGKLQSWWWTGRSGVLWFMGSQRIGHDWVTELNWTELNWTWQLPIRSVVALLNASGRVAQTSSTRGVQGHCRKRDRD